jgi:hypothetical protein
VLAIPSLETHKSTKYNQEGMENVQVRQSFNIIFQTNAMDENTKTPLFKEGQIEEENDPNGKEEETNTNLQVVTIINNSLTKVAKFTTIRSGMSSKKAQQPQGMELSSDFERTLG